MAVVWELTRYQYVMSSLRCVKEGRDMFSQEVQRERGRGEDEERL